MKKEAQGSPSMEQVVLAEIKEKSPNGNMITGFFELTNNFYCKLPSTSGQDDWGREVHRDKTRLAEMRAVRKSRQIDWYLESGEYKSERAALIGLTKLGCSERRLKSTGQEFLNDIGFAIKQSKVDEIRLKGHIEALYKRDSRGDDNTLELLLPVYIKLREMGYTAVDLF